MSCQLVHTDFRSGSVFRCQCGGWVLPDSDVEIEFLFQTPNIYLLIHNLFICMQWLFYSLLTILTFSAIYVYFCFYVTLWYMHILNVLFFVESWCFCCWNNLMSPYLSYVILFYVCITHCLYNQLTFKCHWLSMKVPMCNLWEKVSSKPPHAANRRCLLRRKWYGIAKHWVTVVYWGSAFHSVYLCRINYNISWSGIAFPLCKHCKVSCYWLLDLVWERESDWRSDAV